jgi:hypothetical protein
VKVTDDGVPVETLVAVVKNSIKRAGVSRVSEPGDLRVASVQLILEVVASKTAGGGLSFRVPFIGMKLDMGVKVTKKDTHTIDITLVPPEPQTSREVRGGEVEDVLVNAVATIRSVVAHAAEGDDPWVLSAGIVDIVFVITRTGTISLGVEGELANEITQTLRLGLVSGPELRLPWVLESARRIRVGRACGTGLAGRSRRCGWRGKVTAGSGQGGGVDRRPDSAQDAAGPLPQRAG